MTTKAETTIQGVPMAYKTLNVSDIPANAAGRKSGRWCQLSDFLLRQPHGTAVEVELGADETASQARSNAVTSLRGRRDIRFSVRRDKLYAYRNGEEVS